MKMNNEVLVFATSVQSSRQVKALSRVLNSIAGKGNWNFALEDCDRILRITSTQVNPQAAIRVMRDNGYECAELN